MAGKGEGGHPRMSAGYPTSSSGSEEHKGLKETVQETAAGLSESAGQMTEKAREFVSGVAGRAQETWHSAREGMQERLSTVSDRAGDIWEDAQDFVRRYPIASVAVAFGLGCLVCSAFMMVSHTDDMAERMSRSSS